MNNLLGLNAPEICLSLSVGASALFLKRKSIGKWICAHDKIVVAPSKSERIVHWIKETLSREKSTHPGKLNRVATIALRASALIGGAAFVHMAGYAITHSLFLTISHLKEDADRKLFFITQIQNGLFGDCSLYAFESLPDSNLVKAKFLDRGPCVNYYDDKLCPMYYPRFA